MLSALCEAVPPRSGKLSTRVAQLFVTVRKTHKRAHTHAAVYARVGAWKKNPKG